MTAPQDSSKIDSELTAHIDSDHAANTSRNRLQYDLTTSADLRSYLQEHKSLALFHHQGPTLFDLQPLTGGTANYVYRLTERDTGRTRILKHAAPQLASSQAFSLDPVRMDFEARMLAKKMEDESECHCTKNFDISAVEKTYVHTPPLEFYESDIKLLCIGDAGSKNLKDAYVDLSLGEIRGIGAELGKWLARLHGTTPLSHVTGADGHNNAIGVSIAGYTYRNLADSLKKYTDADTTETISRKVNKFSGDLIPTDRESVCHGDFWPGNIMLRSTSSSKNHLLTVIDWELTRVGSSATDVGQFAAEAMMLDRFHGNKGLLRAFIRAYFEASAARFNSETLYPWMTRIAMHYAVHLVVWPCRGVHWAHQADTRTVALHGLDVLADAVSAAPDVMSWSVFEGLDGSEEMTVKRAELEQNKEDKTGQSSEK